MSKTNRQLLRMTLYTAVVWGTGLLTGIAWETYRTRTGGIGGEILIIPLLVGLFALGWMARGEMEHEELDPD